MCEHCKDLAPGEQARTDQAVAGFNAGVDQLIKKVSGYLDEGDDGPHAAASLAISLSATSTLTQVATLLGFALLRLVEQQRAEMCPCKPSAPEHEHLTGGYALTDEERSGVEWRLAHGQPAWPHEARP